MFKVVPDQLRISDGWVRCGQCDEVFDANSHLRSDVLVHEAWHDTIGTPLRFYEPSRLDGEGFANLVVATEHANEVLQLEYPDAPPEATDFVESTTTHRQESSEAAEIPEADVFVQIDPHGRSEFDQSEESLEIPPTLSFMPVPEKPSLWASPLVRGILAFLCGSAVILLSAQVLVHERDRLAASVPVARPLLSTLCEWAACTILPLRQIESVVIDSSSFTKVRTDVYRLNFTLKNLAQVPVAMPAVELTLTDMQDQALVRRVINVRDFASDDSVMASNAEVSGSLPIAIQLRGVTERISGYRLVAFYP